MARIAYVDHSFHRITKSSMFLSDMLRRRGHEVVNYWDDAWQGGNPVEWQEVQECDVVVMLQSYCRRPSSRAFRELHPNVVYIPMLDQFSAWQGPVCNQAAFWEPFHGSKVLNFSNAVHYLVTNLGIASHWAHYYPEPAPTAPTVEGLHGFFWLRRQNQINWALIRQLLEKSQFDSFHIHLAVDPISPPPELPTPDDVERYRITTSTWFEDRKDLTTLLDRANVYFAPRMEEGIGQSFLEAMAQAKCVVAPNQGTMNEYIVHGLNGLLFDQQAPQALSFSDANRLGRNARESLAIGHLRWLEAEDSIVDFILTPSEKLYAGKYQHVFATPDHMRGDARENFSARQTPHLTLGAALRVLAKQSKFLQVTRPMWHPLVKLARQMRAIWRRS